MPFHNEVLRGNPGSTEAARRQWDSMSGTAGYLLGGHALLRTSDGVIAHTDSETASTTVNFGTPTDDKLAAHVESGEPVQVAGAFTLDGLGGWFIDKIEETPPTSSGSACL